MLGITRVWLPTRQALTQPRYHSMSDVSSILLLGCRSTYYFTDVRVSVGVGVHVTQITKRTPAQIFFGRHVFCSPGHWLSIFAMTLTFALKVKP